MERQIVFDVLRLRLGSMTSPGFRKLADTVYARYVAHAKSLGYSIVPIQEFLATPWTQYVFEVNQLVTSTSRSNVRFGYGIVTGYDVDMHVLVKMGSGRTEKFSYPDIEPADFPEEFLSLVKTMSGEDKAFCLENCPLKKPGRCLEKGGTDE